MEAAQIAIDEGPPDGGLSHWWSFPEPAAEPTQDQLILRDQFDSLLRSSGVDLSIMRRATDRVGHVMRQVIYQSLAVNAIERDALQLTDLHELVIELTPVFHELLADLGLHRGDCTSLRIALHDGPAGARQSMIVSEIVDHYSLRWLWPGSETSADMSSGMGVPLLAQRLSKSQLVLEHLIRQSVYQPLPYTLQVIGLRLKNLLLHRRRQASEVPRGAYWFDLGYVPEAIRYKNDHLLRQQRLIDDILQSRLVRDS